MKYLYPLLAALSLEAAVFDFHTSNLQLLHSNDFDDGTYVFDTSDGDKSTLTLEHYHVWSYGDNFFFIDHTEGEHFSGDDHILYGEWAPRLHIGKMTGWDVPENPLLKALYLSGQFNGDENGYRAYLYGFGTDLSIKGFDVFSLNYYRKEQNIGDDTWQLSSNWLSHLPHGFVFTGFLDWTEDDFLAQPQFLYDLSLNTYGAQTLVGIEWHYYRDKRNSLTGNTPQVMLMLKW
jgi:nucleoside-specific outer membrane channel protein Tsx